MKKKNVLTGIVSLSLVAVLAVGATLAYLTATDTPVTNTFAFGSGMTVTVDEKQPTATGDETITANDKGGFDYSNVVPGQSLNKAPELATTTAVDSYVFVRVSGFGANIKCNGITEGWTKCADVDDNMNGTYYKTVDAADAAQDLGTIFTSVTVSSSLDGKTATTLNDITIQVAAIQQEGFADATAALAQVNAENLFATV